MTTLRDQFALPWQDEAVLLGPFAPAVARASWYGNRHARQPRQRARLWLDADRAQFGDSPMFISSVAVPVKRVRDVLGRLCGCFQDAAFYEDYRDDWMQRFALSVDGWHEASLREEVDPRQGRYGTGVSLNRMHHRARYGFQRFRQRSLAEGGWWPAPRDVTVGLHPQSLMCRATAWFAPHFLAEGGECVRLLWPRPVATPRPEEPYVFPYDD